MLMLGCMLVLIAVCCPSLLCSALQTHSFGAHQLGPGAGSSVSEQMSESSRAGGQLPGGDEAAVLQLMQQSATDLLRRLRPDNYGAFAELFMEAVLQVRHITYAPIDVFSCGCGVQVPEAVWEVLACCVTSHRVVALWLPLLASVLPATR